jgi:hypothetical protein
MNEPKRSAATLVDEFAAEQEWGRVLLTDAERRLLEWAVLMPPESDLRSAFERRLQRIVGMGPARADGA